MASIGDLIMRVVADLKGFTTTVEKEATTAGDKAGKAIAKSTKKSLKSELKGGLLQGLGLGAGLGVVNAVAKGIGAMGDAIGTSIQAASNLNEAMTKSQAVFKGSSDEMEDWAGDASHAFGQSKRQALEAAGTFGNLIQAFGIGSDKAATMSKSLTELASDLASFNNTSVDDAIEALRSGLSGETEPLKRYGVALNDVRLKEEAMRLGLIKTTKGVLPITIKTQAAYSLILKDTALAQGDFERTSDGMANQMKTTAAMAEDTAAKFGTVLLPAVVEFQRVVINALDRTGIAFEDMERAAANGSQGAQNEMRAMQAIADKLGVSVETAFGLVAEAGTKDLATLRGAVFDLERGVTGAKADITTAAGGIEQAFDGMGDEAKTTAIRVDEATGDMITSVEDLRNAAIGYARDIVTKAYQIIEDKAALTAINVEKAELRKVIATGKATREQKARYRELTGEQARLILDLAENGQENTRVVKTAVKQLRDQLKTATGQERIAIQATITALLKLQAQYRNTTKAARGLRLSGGGFVPSGSPNDPRRAAGGPVDANVRYRVNELRQEYFVPDTSGHIAPDLASFQAMTGAASRGDTHINVEMAALPEARDPLAVAVQMRRVVTFYGEDD